MASLGVGVALAALGEPDRARKQPWIPLVAAFKATVEAAAASWYFYQMLDAALSLEVLSLTFE